MPTLTAVCEKCDRLCVSSPCVYCRGKVWGRGIGRGANNATVARVPIITVRVAAYERWVERYPGKAIDYERAVREYLDEKRSTHNVV
jgi:hypothetical protein